MNARGAFLLRIIGSMLDLSILLLLPNLVEPLPQGERVEVGEWQAGEDADALMEHAMRSANAKRRSASLPSTASGSGSAQ